MIGTEQGGCRGTMIRSTESGRCSWKWVEESEAYWTSSFDRLRRVRTSILHGSGDTVIAPEGSREFVDLLRRQDPSFPVELHLVPGDHRLNGPEHMKHLHRLLLEPMV